MFSFTLLDSGKSTSTLTLLLLMFTSQPINSRHRTRFKRKESWHFHPIFITKQLKRDGKEKQLFGQLGLDVLCYFSHLLSTKTWQNMKITVVFKDKLIYHLAKTLDPKLQTCNIFIKSRTCNQGTFKFYKLSMVTSIWKLDLKEVMNITRSSIQALNKTGN